MCAFARALQPWRGVSGQTGLISFHELLRPIVKDK
jgi:hypothetical protein